MVFSAALRAGLVVLVLVASAGCADRRYCRAETVTAAPSGMWIAGAHGVAAFSDGHTIVRRDYPSLAWKYQASAAPEARVVMIRDEAWLFTRAGDVLRYGTSGWMPVTVRWPAVSPPLEVGFVGLGPDGSLVVQLQPQTLAWSPSGAIGARWTAEHLPQVFRWIGFQGGVLYGVGSQAGFRTLYRRAAAGRWEPVGTITNDWEMLALTRIPNGPLAIVTTRELWILEEGQAPTVVLATTLAAGAHPTQPPAALEAPAMQEPSVALTPPAMAGPAASTAQHRDHDPLPGKPPLKIAAQSAQSDGTGVFYVFEASGHGPLLLLSGDKLVEIGAKDVTVMQCPRIGAKLVGAAMTPKGLRLVTDGAALIEVSPGVPCQMVAGPVIREDEM